MHRTNEEIIARIAEVEKLDMFGTIGGDLMSFLPFDLAKPYLKDDATAEKWAEHQVQNDKAAILATMVDYMPFAWGKASDRRGLSAMRSLNHMQAWLWMLGHDKAVTFLDDYTQYGKPQLRAICEAFGWDWRQWDDNRWSSEEDGDGVPAPESVPPLPIEKETT